VTFLEPMYLKPDVLEDHYQKDKLHTAVFKWNNTILLKCFAMWREMLAEIKLSKSREGGSTDGDSDAPPGPPLLTRTVTSVWKEMGSVSGILMGKTGLRNLGNTCYMNSVVQCISNTPLLRQALLSYFRQVSPKGSNGESKGDTGKVKSVFYKLQELMSNMWSGQQAVYTPHDLLEGVWLLGDSFQGYQQQDADELFSTMVAKIEEEVSLSW
jgi:hypothetical protein